VRLQRQLWAYAGLALETHTSADYQCIDGELRRKKKIVSIYGLNKDHNHDLKGLLKSAAITASARSGPLNDYYQGLLTKGTAPPMARLTLARKIAAIVLALWKKGESFDAKKLQSQVA
jgi:hypothetical protein